VSQTWEDDSYRSALRKHLATIDPALLTENGPAPAKQQGRGAEFVAALWVLCHRADLFTKHPKQAEALFLSYVVGLSQRKAASASKWPCTRATRTASSGLGRRCGRLCSTTGWGASSRHEPWCSGHYGAGRGEDPPQEPARPPFRPLEGVPFAVSRRCS
jgi:hypothetical protein